MLTHRTEAFIRLLEHALGECDRCAVKSYLGVMLGPNAWDLCDRGESMLRTWEQERASEGTPKLNGNHGRY